MNLRIMRILGYGALALIAVSVLVMVYWLNQSPKVLEFKQYPIPVQPARLDSGANIVLHLNYCKVQDAYGTVEARLVGKSTELILPWPNDSSKASCVDSPNVGITIPPQAATGLWHVEFNVSYKLNPLKAVPVVIDSQDFTIINSALQGGVQGSGK